MTLPSNPGPAGNPLQQLNADVQGAAESTPDEYGVYLYVWSSPTSNGMGDWGTGYIDDIGDYAVSQIMSDADPNALVSCVRLIEDEQSIWAEPLTITIYHLDDDSVEIEIFGGGEGENGHWEHYDYWIGNEPTQTAETAPATAPGVPSAPPMPPAAVPA